MANGQTSESDRSWETRQLRRRTQRANVCLHADPSLLSSASLRRQECDAQARPLPAYRDRCAAQGFRAAHGFVAAQGLAAAQGLVAEHGLIAAQGFVAPQGFPAMSAVDDAAGWQGLWPAAAGFAATAVPPRTTIVPSAMTAFRSDWHFSMSIDSTSLYWCNVNIQKYRGPTCGSEMPKPHQFDSSTL